jgi:hypothetical protein
LSLLEESCFNRLTKKTPGSFTKVCQTHSFHTE